MTVVDKYKQDIWKKYKSGELSLGGILALKESKDLLWNKAVRKARFWAHTEIRKNNSLEELLIRKKADDIQKSRNRDLREKEKAREKGARGMGLPTVRKEDNHPKRYMDEDIGGSRADNISTQRKQSNDSLKRSRD